MKKNTICFVAAALFCGCLWAEAGSPATRTAVELWFDTEDYTYEPSCTAIRRIAEIMTEEGVKGQFNIVGYLAQCLVDWKRSDVIAALKHHNVGTQTLYHSRYPTICEYTDLANFDAAYRLCLNEEKQCHDLVSKAFGGEKPMLFSVQPGCSSSYVADEVYADLGIPIEGGISAAGKSRCGYFWYQNQLHVLYNTSGVHLDSLTSAQYDEEAFYKRLGTYAGARQIVLSMHPDRAVKKQHWDVENMMAPNTVKEFGTWNPPALHTGEEVELFYARFRKLIRRIKADPRFFFSDSTRLLAAVEPRETITVKDIPAIRASLLKKLGPVTKPSWCVADCFRAAVAFLNGATEWKPGKVYGFLSKPEGVKARVTLRVADLRAAAAKIDFTRHLPVSYEVGGVAIGPADFLFAALEALETKAETVTVVPREQLGALAEDLPEMAKFTHVKHWPIYRETFKDNYLSDRLRWQYWTYRPENGCVTP